MEIFSFFKTLRYFNLASQLHDNRPLHFNYLQSNLKIVYHVSNIYTYDERLKVIKQTPLSSPLMIGYFSICKFEFNEQVGVKCPINLFESRHLSIRNVGKAAVHK